MFTNKTTVGYLLYASNVDFTPSILKTGIARSHINTFAYVKGISTFMSFQCFVNVPPKHVRHLSPLFAP